MAHSTKDTRLANAGLADEEDVLMVACRLDDLVDDGLARRWQVTVPSSAPGYVMAVWL